MDWTIYITYPDVARSRAVKIVQADTHRKAWRMARERNRNIHTSCIRVERGAMTWVDA